MITNTCPTCPTCQTVIPANAAGGFCPACLLRDAEEPPTSGHGALPLEEIAAAFPQWEVLGLIGQGGMGYVYKVRQPNLDRTVAMKILSPELSRDPAFAERFAREARTLGKLHHPNIVTVFEHGEKDGFFYLLMEYVDGVNLRQAMRAGRFSPEQALAIVPGICDALQAAHAQGIWHRDIKPENILLDREGNVKIADFGIARIVGDPQRDFTLTRTGNALGSVSYMAPEQHEKPHEVDHRADIYSLGVVIYEMLTGELPLGRFPSPSQRAAVDSRIDEIVLKTLEKEREMRQQSATEVKTDINLAMAGGGIPKAQTAAPQEKRGLARLAFGVFLFGIVIPFALWIISVQAAEAGFVLSALLMLLALVLGLFSFRATLGKITVVCSMLTLLLYGAFIAMIARGIGPVEPLGNQVESGNSQPQTGSDSPAPENATESTPKTANERNNTASSQGIDNEGATESAKTHLNRIFKGSPKELETTYAPKVTLMPGHEFLAEQYGLAGVGARAIGAEVDRDRLIAAMETAAAGRPARPAQAVDSMLASMKYEVIQAGEGDGEVAPTDQVGTPDGKLQFRVQQGDVLLKVAPPEGDDFLFLHLRKIDGSWRIVSEYLD